MLPEARSQWHERHRLETQTCRNAHPQLGREGAPEYVDSSLHVHVCIVRANTDIFTDRLWILEELPAGYQLWEHVKWNEKSTKNKNKHAAGYYDRQDAYLYGHPYGRKKRYRSPADFFPHLLWLAVDKDGDHRNCSCKICSPDGDELTDEMIKSGVQVPGPQALKDPPAKDSPKGIHPSVPASKKMLSMFTVLHTDILDPPSKPSPQPSVSAPPRTTANASTIQTRSREQMLDSEPNGKYIYRPGELVWFNKGQAWGLSVVAKRQFLNDSPRYLVQPLSHPFRHPPYQIKDQEDQLRPWLAWSVPSTTHAEIANTPYDQVQWDRVLRGDFGRGDAEVDGSILAAKVIDTSYSLFDRLEVPTAAGEVHYNGMFLGAEKIWVGEPVRLRVPGEDIVVLIIHKLIERTAPPSTSTVTFIGDVYKFVQMPMPYKSRAEWPTPDLPPRMVADLQFRNEVADAVNRGTWCEWRLLEPAARRGLSDIKGRWYETHALLPILKGQQAFHQEIAQGIASDVSTSMNGRGDSSQATSQRKKNRKDTLGRAVPADFKVSRGLDGSPADDLFPDAQQPPAFDQFMDIDQAGGDQFFGGV